MYNQLYLTEAIWKMRIAVSESHTNQSVCVWLEVEREGEGANSGALNQSLSYLSFQAWHHPAVPVTFES